VLVDPVSEWWLDRDEVPPCGNTPTNQCTSGWMSNDRHMLADELEIQLRSVDTERDQLPEVSFGELEFLLLMDGAREIADDGMITDVDSLPTATEQQYSFVQQKPASMTLDVSETSSVDEDDNDIEDTTWTVRTHAAKPRRRRRICRRSQHKRRRSAAATNTTADDRKKQQNKSAATRYREKKRCEEIKNEAKCVELEKRNKELHSRVLDMTQEVAVLRKLVIDIFRNPNATTV